MKQLPLKLPYGEDHVWHMLRTDDRWALRGLMRLDSEGRLKEGILISYARQYRHRGRLSIPQLRVLKQIMPKYAKILTSYSQLI